MPLKVVFFGTPAFAVPALEALVRSPHRVVGVVSQPDKPRGRGRLVSGSPVRVAAEALGLPVLTPVKLTDADFRTRMQELAPDLGVVAAYGRLLPAALLDLPRLGMINVHASLLPRWRGAAPVHRAILAGDTTTGVTIMRVIPALDAGPMLLATEMAVGPNETSPQLEARLASAGADLLVTVVQNLAGGPVRESPQDETRVTYASRLDRKEARIEFDRPARDVHNAIRGLQPWPMASAVLNGRRIILHASELASEGRTPEAPGAIVQIDADAINVACRPGVVSIRRVQLEGRPVVSVSAYLSGHSTRTGDRFEPWDVSAA